MTALEDELKAYIAKRNELLKAFDVPGVRALMKSMGNYVPSDDAVLTLAMHKARIHLRVVMPTEARESEEYVRRWREGMV